jgi:uncharacterized protein YneR
MGVPFVYHLFKDPDIVGEIKAPVHVNIEIDKKYTYLISVIANLNGGDRLFPISPTTVTEDTIKTVVLYGEIKQKTQAPFVHALSLRIPKESAAGVLDAIDGISVFIGNKTFYFSHSRVIGLPGREQGGYLLYKLPGLEYKKSLIGSWINWYGDFNLAVKTAMAFFVYPAQFIITWLFLICLLIICRSEIAGIYRVLRKQHIVLLELLPLGFVVLAGFMLRFNGYIRYSSWGDELYSACTASNPNRPFLSTFEDPGNPPFYFILLRCWFVVFGWTEQSGRLFSVLLGSAAIISLYVMVKWFTNRKTAFLAAVFMAANTFLIGYSQEMRGYILEVFLVPLVVIRFFVFVQERERIFTNLAWYGILSILLVNTHYYGSLFVLANFIFYILYSIKTKTFIWKKTLLFLAGNITTALSLLPFFIHTALRRALLNTVFNSWIPSPGIMLQCTAAAIPLFLLVYVYLRRTVFPGIISKQRRYLLDYMLFTSAAVFLMAFGVSLYRPILYQRYLILLIPFLPAALALVLAGVFENSHSKPVAMLCAIGIYICILSGHESKVGGSTSAYRESYVYISRDAESHPQNKSGEYPPVWHRADAERFYGYSFNKLPWYVSGDTYDVLYFNPLKNFEKELDAAIVALDVKPEKILRIRVNERTSVFKIYP